MFELQLGSGAAAAVDPWARLVPIMAAHRVKLDAAEFREAVERVLQAGGAQAYDAARPGLYGSLPAPFQLLAGDFLREFPPPNPRMSALDIGCGTGLSSELLLSTRLGAFVRHIDLVDPSQQMLQVCSTRQSLNAIRHRMICGEIGSLPARARFDVIVAVGVLHKSGDLGELLRQVGMRQSAGGIFLHLHDPNGDYLRDPEYLERTAKLARERRGIFRRVSGRMREQSATAERVREVNEELLRGKVIRTALSGAELECVAGLEGREERPVSMRELQPMLPDYRLVSTRSYAFFGEPATALPAGLRKLENLLAEKRAVNGARVGGIWRKMA